MRRGKTRHRESCHRRPQWDNGNSENKPKKKRVDDHRVHCSRTGTRNLCLKRSAFSDERDQTSRGAGTTRVCVCLRLSVRARPDLSPTHLSVVVLWQVQ